MKKLMIGITKDKSTTTFFCFLFTETTDNRIILYFFCTMCGPEIYQMLSQRQKILYGFSTKTPKSIHERLKTKMDPDRLPEDYYEALEL